MLFRGDLSDLLIPLYLVVIPKIRFVTREYTKIDLTTEFTPVE